MSVKNIKSDEFEKEVLNSLEPVLLDFWAPWCGPCKALGPILDEVAQEKGEKLKIVKVNVDENQDLAINFAVRGIPTMLLFKEGDVVANKIGASSKDDILSWLTTYL